MRRTTVMKTMSLQIDGMSCGHCVARVEKALGKLEGVVVDHVQVGAAQVRYDPSRATPERIRQAVEDAGYDVRQVEEAA
jgi:copper chaperone